jgi:hypothetical protein
MTEIKRPVFFSGENPAMTLFIPGTEQVAAIASYWHCTDSPQGIGHALVLRLAAEDATFGHGGIFTDNPVLARTLVENLTQHFPEFEGVPIDTLPYANAQCGHTYDGSHYQVRCQTPTLQIELEWSELLDRKQVVWPQFPAGETTYDLTTVICPCRSGHIHINGQELSGEVKIAQAADGAQSSTAFLAFAETWIGPSQ